MLVLEMFSHPQSCLKFCLQRILLKLPFFARAKRPLDCCVRPKMTVSSLGAFRSSKALFYPLEIVRYYMSKAEIETQISDPRRKIMEEIILLKI